MEPFSFHCLKCPLFEAQEDGLPQSIMHIIVLCFGFCVGFCVAWGLLANVIGLPDVIAGS